MLYCTTEQIDPELAHFIVSRGEDMYLKMLLVDNLMHADLHPGEQCSTAASQTACTSGYCSSSSQQLEQCLA
jgi:predicted unusual protein kinase regulating ubiquinone biosynthesis (AarF/ABC1/UbiB family)